MRKKAGPDQGPILGGKRLSSPLQAFGIGHLPVAAERKRSQSPHHAAIPLAHGRTQH